ncbi:MAG: cell envelope biogenesis protein OmpA, partial [SAR324 cluster bacterium]|nr:cell envelope biogenesis protein OmpA [SAR324 cluster bacterium]
MAQSYYKTIHGVRYDRSLLEAADERIAGQGDGRISEQDAKELVELSKDGGRVTETELRTLKHIRENYRFTPKAAAWFAGQLPAIEQAVHPDQLAQPEPPRPAPPPTQASPPPSRQQPPAPQPWPEEAVTIEESPNSPIPHVIWGMLLLASIIIGVVFYQGATEQVEILEARLAAVPDTRQL